MGRNSGNLKEKKRKKRVLATPKVVKKRVDIDVEAIDFRNVELLKRYVTENGRILPRRITGLPAKLHRRLTREIKRARNVLLMK
ncbi:30S ribosomal protein S18 [Candidatus Methylacidiphilum fumarolicum]|uniref:Small ribosomal subunit protein bS18 n=2 Tax=Candidatus Methylacidiphilum fumarolicum TaxID=591154 RepID=I0JWL9_METFB|nr:30S ribosomal protein S18 [Candidatus Methylacidiphilum fumarolicum]MBW6414330.1 30S ribosomal protein S18 [Candidatus Methylacidiphilum fumarolicum]TFE65826.1 30S ribosomal protein S18 [Candidatus Methylacidiphilum fumarolicum]TFE71201.1 30S ribosomal protein S18 [Candidatus Methylacidiphilum fumarolicum]TFE71652.1 30S ribosomal protein S18 [Candidatus Methylacidiphilum fumarolicum]TFE76886.1 30S ribosomal protein S18 [Candidatus Methylacidiphilum fumarolicum]